MDDELKALEMELKRLRPVAPRAAVAQRIGARLHHGRRSLWWLGLLVPAAAAIAMLLAAPWQKAEPTSTDRMRIGSDVVESSDVSFKPFAVENVLYSAQDEGIVTLQDGTAARRQRLQYMDTITWRNPRTNASLKWTVPREEVRVVPVALQ